MSSVKDLASKRILGNVATVKLEHKQAEPDINSRTLSNWYIDNRSQ